MEISTHCRVLRQELFRTKAGSKQRVSSRRGTYPDSQTLAQGAWCAQDQGLYYPYHDFIYSHQGQENTGWAAPAKLRVLLGNMSGLDIQQFGLCLDSQKYSSRVQQLTQLGQSLGATGTPSVLIGNNQVGYVKVVGAQPYSVFQRVIDTQLAKAR